MSKTKRTATGVLIIVSVLTVAISVKGGEAAAPGVTRRAIRDIHVGMTEEDVVRILGAPFSTFDDPPRQGRTLEYTTPVRWARVYPMLWVNFKAGRVNNVYVKRYVWWGLNDEGIYVHDPHGTSEAKIFEATFRP